MKQEIPIDLKSYEKMIRDLVNSALSRTYQG
ncbi:g106 [Yersinia phage phiR1-37]|nr:hypothetical protein phiR1-37_gp106 [Yersinia phage phiR1-37]CCE26130.1 g106 [Yersinia phage phiR1-37]